MGSLEGGSAPNSTFVIFHNTGKMSSTVVLVSATPTVSGDDTPTLWQDTQENSSYEGSEGNGDNLFESKDTARDGRSRRRWPDSSFDVGQSAPRDFELFG